jgi:hypothetical protein
MDLACRPRVVGSCEDPRLLGPGSELMANESTV